MQHVTNEPVEFEKQPVEVEDIRESTHHFESELENTSQISKENGQMSTYNWLDMETLGS